MLEEYTTKTAVSIYGDKQNDVASIAELDCSVDISEVSPRDGEPLLSFAMLQLRCQSMLIDGEPTAWRSRGVQRLCTARTGTDPGATSITAQRDGVWLASSRRKRNGGV